MIITTAYKSTDFDRLCEISDACYTGDERPPRDVMKSMVEVCDVFLAKTDHEHSFTSPANDDAQQCDSDCRHNWHKCSVCGHSRSEIEASPTNDIIVGFALVRTSGNPYIWSIAVDKGFQGRGVGGNLLREIIKKYTLQKALCITLHVHEDNPAQKLYFDYGFRMRDVVKYYYAPKNGLLMIRTLP
jgi:ribosomal protein S18 acetylase RimI-like enzyme